VELCVGNPQFRVKCGLALRVDVTRDQKISPTGVFEYCLGSASWASALAAARAVAAMLKITQRLKQSRRSNISIPGNLAGDLFVK